jgi:murein DD-endopeptidase MepM/ murein hydrolase activator NlpD
MNQAGRTLPRAATRVGALLSVALGLAGCGAGAPAPVVSREQQPPPPAQIIVQHGQTLSGIAHAYHVPMAVLAEANHLAPPYRIRAGQALIVPGAAEPGSQLALAEPMPPTAAAAMPPPAPVSVRAVPLAPPVTRPAEPLPRPAGLPPPSAAMPPAAASMAHPPPGSASAPSPASRREPAASGEASAPSASRRELSPSGLPAPTAAAEPPPTPSRGGASSTFLWPVHGRVLEAFGAGPDGSHNDGINIAAPRGAAVEATDAGVVAYTGNELRGYGNLILIKHPNGWISAYAHCDLILVKPGQKIARGQVIARVGATGNVSEPQLHFELRRGKKPVDPRQYLPPASTAAAKAASPG